MPVLWTQPGEMRHVVSIEQKSQTRGSMGELVETWTEVAQIWCKIWPVRGREASESRRETGKVETRFNARYRSGIDQGMRLKYGTRYYDIVSVINVMEANRELEIAAVETI